MSKQEQDITIPGGTEAVELIDRIGGDKVFELTDPKAAGLAIMQRIMDAETLDDVLNMSKTTGTDDLLDKQIVVLGAEWRKSSPGFEEGPGFYATMTYRDFDPAGVEITSIDGQTIRVSAKDRVASVGGQNVLAQLAVIKDKNFLPFACKVVKTEKPTARGFYPLWLVPAA